MIAVRKQPAPLIWEGCEGKKLLSNSSRGAFTFCPQSFKLGVLDGLKRRVTPRPFGFGHALHEALELHYQGFGLDDIRVAVAEWRDEAVGKVKACPDPGYTVEDVDADASLVLDMVERYLAMFGNDLEKYEVLAIEQPFVVPIAQKLSNGTLRTDPVYAYAGVFDLVVRDRRTRQVFIVDHKSTASTDLAEYEEDVEAAGAGQRIGYVYAARFWWPETVGLIYNVLRKKAPAAVSTTQCKVCKGGTGQVETKVYQLDEKGKRVKDEAGSFVMLPSTFAPCEACHETGYGGISKTVPDTTLERFDAEIADLLACNPNMSREYIDENRAQLAERVGRKSRFLYRFEVPVYTGDIEEWMADIYEIAHQMARSLKIGRWYRNLQACNVNGRRCWAFKICLRGCDDAVNWERKPRDPFLPGEVFKTNSNEEEA